ncbi:TPA: DNA polymerase III subunit beta, partial [Candidatus Bathyarchaeota archaeon]|nr:DNA polymerase III subunit beta [Candidatus Bathyarchaeota archaeon]
RELSFEILTYTPEEFEELKERSVILKDASRYWIKL